MGFLDQAGAILSKFGGSQDQQHSVLSSVISWINGPEVGGVPGIVDKFKQAGLGHIADKWAPPGPNPPVSADQLQKVFSNEQVRAIAAKLGVDPDEALQHLSQML